MNLNKNNGKTSLSFREQMSSKAFGLTAYYDAMIANWFNKKLNIEFPERKTYLVNNLKNLDMVKILIKKVRFTLMITMIKSLDSFNYMVKI